MDSSYPYIIRIEVNGDSSHVVAQIATPTSAMACLKCAAAEHPDARVTLYINGHPAIEEGPLIPLSGHDPGDVNHVMAHAADPRQIALTA